MSLLVGLMVRLLTVAIICFAAAVTWILVEAQNGVRVETRQSAERASHVIERSYMTGSVGRPLDFTREPSGASSNIVSVMSPGVCVSAEDRQGVRRRLCSGWTTLGPVAPEWFRRFYAAVTPANLPVEVSASVHGEASRPVRASFDPVAAAARAWNRVRMAVALAASMAVGMSVLAALAVLHAVSPVQAIISGLKRLESGDETSRLPHFSTDEFQRIASAFNDLAGQLEQRTNERGALMRQLFAVQEEERKALARDLHDEFGQCLTAAGALSLSVEAGALPDRPDLAEEARTIGRINAKMMSTLRGAFARLRPPDLEELGLEASLQAMVQGWAVTQGSRTSFKLEVDGDLADISAKAALDIYRIVQECLTNAARHGQPQQVMVQISRRAGADDVTVVVADDGGGHLQEISKSGFGILGIKERIGLLGGSLTIGGANGGMRIAAVLPAAACGSPA
jgi:signal transduction histidine kinase